MGDRLLVRARLKDDIEQYFADAEIQVDAGTDYKYRALVARADAVRTVASMVKEIDYDNFKAGVEDRFRIRWYIKVWETMCMMQTAAHEEGHQ